MIKLARNLAHAYNLRPRLLFIILGWTVFQRRVNGQTDFNRTWTEYKSSFGSPSSNWWLGLENVHALSKQAKKLSEIRFVMETFEDAPRRWLANYDNSEVKGEDDKYRIKLGTYSGQ